MNESDANDESGASEGRTDDRSVLEDRPLGAGVVTISTERTLSADAAGEAIVTGLERVGHEIATREHIDADHDQIQSIVSRMIDRDDVDFVVTAGATSVEPDDVTIEAVEPLLDKRLSAFSELFTVMGYEAIGSHIVAARTLAGVAEDVPVFCLPGKEEAARLGVERIILPETRYLVDIAHEERDESEPITNGAEGDENGESDESGGGEPDA